MHLAVSLHGITPAYAGSTLQKLQDQRSPQDHPRIRGKHLSGKPSPSISLGSPPHTREARNFTLTARMFLRITPAYAGSTTNTIRRLMLSEDHPRIRGKYERAEQRAILALGSPPHTREVRLLNLKAFLAVRITPAYAGSTVFLHQRAHIPKDHPRIRGKYLAQSTARTPRLGSPPHTREVHLCYSCSISASGITPAYAGSTMSDALHDTCCWITPAYAGSTVLCVV